MILLDDRVGAVELRDPLTALGAQVLVTRMEYGDIACGGEGPDGPVSLGVERKRVTDLLQSIESGRLTGRGHDHLGQVQGLLRDFDYGYLLVEGGWRATRDGLLEIPRGGGWVVPHGRRWMLRDVWMYLHAVQATTGIPTLRTSGVWESARLLHALASWWGKPWGSHRTGKTVYRSGPKVAPLGPPSLGMQLAAAIPEVGWEYAAAADGAFPSIQAMMAGSVEAWAEVRPDGVTRLGRRRPKLGKARAERIVRRLQG